MTHNSSSGSEQCYCDIYSESYCRHDMDKLRAQNKAQAGLIAELVQALEKIYRDGVHKGFNDEDIVVTREAQIAKEALRRAKEGK